MSIQDLSSKLKGLLSNSEYLLAILIVIVSLSSFALGRLSIGQKSPETLPKIQRMEAQVIAPTQDQVSQPSVVASTSKIADPLEQGSYVASKTGTKYHLPWCGSAKLIKEENKIWFKTKEEAEKAGYAPASNCKGM